MQLQAEIEDTQQELVIRLSEALELHSTNTGNHVKRVAYLCHALAKEIGLSDKEAELVKMASPLHDVARWGSPMPF